ncbi:MAG TPA: molybdopterin converting factor subunit 1 [Metalysinibacillus jejuensis]|uniref:Molybdopterin synthase sulfur carrier subunit n=1 Tax=Metalysinibacillus jejuensis TaxID=914327 RepID=A0A921NDD0_9BACL|nr:molybdopterin converting factor subunit 1 [Metalysinibacillus jejuensis]
MINILLFAHLQESVGQEKLQVDLPASSVLEIKTWLSTNYNLSLQNVLAAVNEAFAKDDTIVNPGDTIAFIPPISGG